MYLVQLTCNRKTRRWCPQAVFSTLVGPSSSRRQASQISGYFYNLKSMKRVQNKFSIDEGAKPASSVLIHSHRRTKKMCPKKNSHSFLFFFLLWNRIKKRLRCFDLNIISKMLINGRFLTRLGLFSNAPLPSRSCLSRSSIENYWSDNVTFYRRSSLSATFFAKNAGGENNSFFIKIILFYEIKS